LNHADFVGVVLFKSNSIIAVFGGEARAGILDREEELKRDLRIIKINIV